MSSSLSSVTVETGGLPDIRRRFIDNDAPVVFSYKAGGSRAERELRQLVGWPGEWIGYDVDTPDAAAIVRAEELLRVIRRVAADLDGWSDPHVSAGQDGEVVLEWWGREKKITLYVSADSVDCIRVWGPDVDSEMDECTLGDENAVRSVWNWLRA